MVVANSWGVRNAAPSSSVCYLKPSSCFPFSAGYYYYYGKKESNLSFFESSILNRPKSRNSVRNSKLCCRCTDSSAEWDWNRWNRHFSEIEQAESFTSVLKFQLEDAIEKEDFLEAAKLKTAIAEATSKDIVAEIMSQLKTAIDEERYHDASKLCKLTGSGLVGWWVGFPKDSNDPFGRIVRITPSVGRFVARSYTPRQLVTASSGTPLFEIFVIKEADQSYNMQVVFLLREKGSSTESTSSPLKLREGPSISNSETLSTREVPINEKDGGKRSEEKTVNSKDDSEEEINNVIKFLKDRIPGLTVKLKKDSVQEEMVGDSDPLEKLTQEDEEKTRSAENSDDEADNMDDIQGEGVKVGGGTGTTDEGKKSAVKLFVGGVLHHLEGSTSKEDYVRSPAAIKDMERDSFVLHIPGRIKDVDESKASNIEVAAIAAQGASVLMPPDVAKAFWGVGSTDKAASKVSKDVRQMAKLVISQMLNRLPETTSFSRISPSTDDLDPFNGLYVGAFGPYGTEVVQLRRKFGHWHDGDQMNKFSDTEFYEYVEAVKLTGDLIVPAGQVLFRAKIGKGNRIVDRMRYPDQIGVVASYKGEGRIAEFGFQNPRWVDGELLQLNGKGLKVYLRGATLGFLYVVPEKRYLVLFNRLKLPEFSV